MLIIKPPEEREIIQQRVLMCQLKKAATFIIKKKALTVVHEKKGLGSLAETNRWKEPQRKYIVSCLVTNSLLQFHFYLVSKMFFQNEALRVMSFKTRLRTHKNEMVSYPFSTCSHTLTSR